jgi:hypothetical protein
MKILRAVISRFFMNQAVRLLRRPVLMILQEQKKPGGIFSINASDRGQVETRRFEASQVPLINPVLGK